MTDHLPRQDVELPPRMPEAAIIAALRAELAQARADTDAAVALAYETAADLHAKLWRETSGYKEAQIRAIAPASGVAKLEALRAERDDARRLFLQACEPIAASPDIADVVAAVEEWMNRRGGEDTADQIAIMAIQSYQRAMQPERDRLAAELAAAKQREARRTFPILKGDGAKIDYQLVADHSEQARRNHYQSVDQLASRGGLSWGELYAVLHNRECEKVDTNEAMIACRSLEARYLAALSNNGSKAELAAAKQREAEIKDMVLAVENAINEPPRRWAVEPMEVRDYRHDLYRVWSPLCAALAPVPPADTWHERRTMLPDGDARAVKARGE